MRDRRAGLRQSASMSTRSAPSVTRSPARKLTAATTPRARRGDRVLHLHRLEDHQRRALRDAVAGADQHGDDGARHRRHQVPAVRFLLAGVRERIDEHQLRMHAAAEHVALLAAAHDGRREFPPRASR